MIKHYWPNSLIIILLVLLTACEPDLAPGIDLSGRNLKGRDLRGFDLTGANLSGADLSNAILGLGGSVKSEEDFNEMICFPQWLNTSNLFALCEQDNIRIWDIHKNTFVQSIKTPDGYVPTALSPDGTILALMANDFEAAVVLMDIKTNTIYPLAVEGHNISSIHTFAWSPDGSYLVLTGFGTTWLWDIKNNTLVDRINTIGHFSSSPIWSNDSKTLVYFNSDALEYWNIELNDRYQMPYNNNTRIDFIDWSPDDKIVVALDSLAFHESPQGYLIYAKSDIFIRNLENIRIICGDCDLKSIAWSPDRPIITGGTSDGSIVIWDTETGSIVSTFEAHQYEINYLRWSEDGSFLISKSGDNVKLWDVRQIFNTTILTGVNLSDANLSGANMAGLDLRKATLAGANLSGAMLKGANLSGMDLRTVILDNANLGGANLTNSDLRDVNLLGVIISEAKLENTNLMGADFDTAQFEYLLNPVCKGIGIDAMPPYTSQQGIHALMMMSNNGEIHQWNKVISDKWRPTNDHLPEIVVCIGERTLNKIDYCSYGAAGAFSYSVPLVQISMDMILREAHSGSIIASTTINGSIAACPYQIEMGTGAVAVGGTEPQLSDAEAWLAEYIEK